MPFSGSSRLVWITGLVLTQPGHPSSLTKHFAPGAIFSRITAGNSFRGAGGCDGRAIDGIEGLKSLMLEDKDKIARNLLTKLSEYALGREMNYADSETIHRLLAASKKNDYKLRDLVVGIIADESFTKR